MDNYSKFVSDGGITLSSPRLIYDDEGIPSRSLNKGEIEVYKMDKATFMGRRPGYTYLNYDIHDNEGNVIGQEKIFYYDDIEISEDDVPKDSFEYIEGVKMGYDRTWNEYVKYNKKYAVYDETPSYIELLNTLNIKSREDWKKWLLLVHPDNDVNIDIILVGLANNAVEMRFPESVDNIY